jgi:hypothetical protein
MPNDVFRNAVRRLRRRFENPAVGPPSKLSSKFQFFNLYLQAVDLIGFLSISSRPEIEESGITQGHDAD